MRLRGSWGALGVGIERKHFFNRDLGFWFRGVVIVRVTGRVVTRTETQKMLTKDEVGWEEGVEGKLGSGPGWALESMRSTIRRRMDRKGIVVDSRRTHFI